MRSRRIANPPAQLHFEVVGVHSSATFLDVARRAGRPVDYRLADMQELTPDGPFGAVINWFTSFGYFDDATSRAMLASWQRALRPGRKLVIDHQNRQRLFGLIATTGGQWLAMSDRGDDLPIDRTTFDVASGRTSTERISVRDGRVRRYWFSVRTFAFTELRDCAHVKACLGALWSSSPVSGRRVVLTDLVSSAVRMIYPSQVHDSITCVLSRAAPAEAYVASAASLSSSVSTNMP